MRFSIFGLHVAARPLFGAAAKYRDPQSSLLLVSYQPSGSRTWHWSISIRPTYSLRPWSRRLACLAERRTGQWHDHFRLFGGHDLVVSRQDYHKRGVMPFATQSI